MSNIQLFQLPRSWLVPNASHFSCKLETYLRLAGIDYELKRGYPASAPKGKIPYLKIDGAIISDTRLIVDALIEKFGDRLDSTLTIEQKAVAHALQRMIEEHLFWISIYSRCDTTPENWRETKQALMGALPPSIRETVAEDFQKRMRVKCIEQGIGKLNESEIAALGDKDIAAVSDILGDKAFMMGDKPTALDATVFGFLVNITHVPIECPLKESAMRRQNIVDYCDRMFRRYYPELLAAT